ncbi:hypothetical protein G3M48_008315 [Beauveria asiatica]|uniref:Uncharacterized protein n=1 Tax=Beauveria asiatica TaxID=1069075 RepID=A0AAW0S498_9HYPO
MPCITTNLSTAPEKAPKLPSRLRRNKKCHPPVEVPLPATVGRRHRMYRAQTTTTHQHNPTPPFDARHYTAFAPSFPHCRLSLSLQTHPPRQVLADGFASFSQARLVLSLSAAQAPSSALCRIRCPPALFSLLVFPGGNLACCSVRGFAVWLAGLKGQHNRQSPYTPHQPTNRPSSNPQQSSTTANSRMLH